MIKSQSGSLEEQVLRLAAEVERGRRRLMLVSGLGALVMLVAAVSPARELQVRKLELVDLHGTPVMRLESWGPGEASLWMGGAGGQETRLVNSVSGVSYLSFGKSARTGGNRLWLGTHAGHSSVNVKDSVGTSRVSIDVADDEQVFKVVDQSGTMHASIGGDSPREQSMFLGDPHGGPATGMTATTQGIGVFVR